MIRRVHHKMDFIFDPSLVLYLPLCELDAGAIMSGDAYGHPGVVTGAVWRPEGRAFDGSDDQISLGNPSPFQWGVGDFTLEIWGKDTKATDSRFVEKGYYTVGQNGNWVLRSHKTQGLQFYVWEGQGAPNLTNFDWSGFTSIYSNWNHMVITRQSGNLIMYVNTVSRATATFSTSIGVNTSDILLGGNAEYFAGTVGEIRIYNRALSPAEIQHNYLATKWRYS